MRESDKSNLLSVPIVRSIHLVVEGSFKPMRNTQTEMGKISNLITDMTLRGAVPEELARAVRHSMVVIDASSHLHK